MHLIKRSLALRAVFGVLMLALFPVTAQALAQARTHLPFRLAGHAVQSRIRSSLGLRAGLVNGLEARSAAGVFSAAGGLTTPGTIGVLPSVPVGNLPQGAAFDPATDTVYVANQLDNTVSVVDTRHCNALDTSGCAQTPPTVPTGAGPFSIAIDHVTHTVYVANQNNNTVSVINGATCNARNTSGCGQTPPVVEAGPTPFGIAVDPATDTVYVADSGGPGDTVSMIDGATCNATVSTGCGQTPATVTVGQFPFLILVDPQDSTVYVTNAGNNTVSMIDDQTCNAARTVGCTHTPPTVAVDSFPLPLALDTRTGTLYVGSQADPVVDVINATKCSALNTTGCGGTHPKLHIEGGTDGMSVDERTDTLFVANNGPGPSPAQERSVSVINAATCNARTTVGCGQHAPTALTGVNPGGNVTDPATNTEYVTTFDNTLQVINEATCNATVRTGCGQPTPATVAEPDPLSIAINPATSTAYIGNPIGSSEGFPFMLALINTATCNPGDSTDCSATPTTVPMQLAPWGLAVDKATDTLYATNAFDSNFNPGNTVSVIDGATCNATVTSGCASTPAGVTVGSLPLGLAVNQATNTIYVANANDNTVSVIDGATCNATDTSGCGNAPPQVPLGSSPLSVAVDEATDTIYVLNPGTPATVSVVNGATCNATITSGCSNVPPTVTVGNGGGVSGIAVDAATDTIYVANTADDTVSAIDGATCNAADTAGCDQTPPHVAVGSPSFGGITVDPASDLVYATNGLDDTVSIIDGATCNATQTISCNQTPPVVPGGGGPSAAAINPNDGTVYVVDSGAATATFFRFLAPQKLTNLAARAGHRSATLSWQPPYDGGLPIIYHVIPSPACPACTGLTTPSTSGIPATVITGLTRGRTYTFTVRATDAAGTGPASAPSNPITP